MLSKEECEKALEHLIECKQRKLCDKCKFKLRCTMSNDELVINQLIEEHFEPKENTSEFKHFKLHSDSALKNLTKNELIDYIKMLYHNWGVADEQLKNCINKAKKLSDSNDELERTIHSLDCELSDVYNPKPYKFEDLKPNMWVYDGIEKLICQIGLISKNAIHREYVDGTISDSPFEENRFFPVQYANYLGGI